jgi:hypothetical protein
MIGNARDRAVRLTTSLPQDLAEVYRHAASALGISVSQVVRDALEDGAAAVQAMATITEQVRAGKVHAAANSYAQIAQTMMSEAMQGMTQANLLMLDNLPKRRTPPPDRSPRRTLSGPLAATLAADSEVARFLVVDARYADLTEMTRRYPALLPSLDALWAFRTGRPVTTSCKRCGSLLQVTAEPNSHLITCEKACLELEYDDQGLLTGHLGYVSYHLEQASASSLA